MEKVTNNFKETEQFGFVLAKEILEEKNGNEHAIILTLKGSLGAGKTTFIQGFAKGLGVKQKVLSPTFIIFNKYPLKGNRFKNFYHFDCYRIENEQEIINLGFEDIISDKKNIVCIEWPEKIKKSLPLNCTSLAFKILKEDKRKINYGKR
ncbi:MAG: tRNA (adenosine(37)-N6)-threonylcarbamoyltransferase complex ATPase subunit type 1 TsaE [Candidatus Pacebacteria bacterium]|nr:tRNA (adenosine(37)-N6)-threonylcarbamoyltransferase complex ATPase subunit type 1 TsaE [Candidatus Paceibacterota bacterium]